MGVQIYISKGAQFEFHFISDQQHLLVGGGVGGSNFKITQKTDMGVQIHILKGAEFEFHFIFHP